MDPFNKLCEALIEIPDNLQRANIEAAIVFVKHCREQRAESKTREEILNGVENTNGVSYEAGERHLVEHANVLNRSRLVSISEAAKLAKKSRPVIYRNIRQGKLKEYKDRATGEKRVRLADVMA